MKRLICVLAGLLIFSTGCTTSHRKQEQPLKSSKSMPSSVVKKIEPSLQPSPFAPAPPSISKKKELNVKLISEADKLLANGHIDEALKKYSQVLKKNPDSQQAVFGTTLALLEMKNYKESLRQINTYMKEHPEEVKPEFFMTRSTINVSLENLDKAEKDIKKAIKLGGEKTPCRVLLANVYCAQGYPEKSVKIAEELLKKDPLLLADNKNSSTPECRARFLNSIGVAYANCGLYDKSIDCFNKSYELNKEDHWTINERGYTYFYKGDVKKAKEDMKLWFDYNPPLETAPELEAMAIALMIMEDYDEALRYANLAINKDPGKPGLICTRGQVYMWMGDQKRAIEDFKLLLKIGNPNFKKEARNYLKYMEENKT